MGHDYDCCSCWNCVGIGEVFGQKTRAKPKAVGKDELTKLRDVISTMQTDLDEIKTDLRTVVIQMDDFNLY